MKVRKTLITITACMTPMLLHAESNFYGIINTTMVDRDSAPSITFQDYGFAPTRFGFTISEDIGNGLKVGGDIEINAGSGSTPSNRKASINISGDFGAVELGRGYSTTFVMDSIDASGTWWADPMGWLNQFAATGAPAFVPTHTAMSTVINDRLMYTSPNWSGFQFKAQIGDNPTATAADSNATEYLLTYGGNGITARYFSIDTGVANSDPINGLLLGYSSPIGVNVSYQSTSQDNSTNANEDTFSGWKIGYSMEKHHFSYSLSTIDNGGGTDYERAALTYQLDLNSNIKAWAQYSDEEFGALTDDAIAIGAALFF